STALFVDGLLLKATLNSSLTCSAEVSGCFELQAIKADAASYCPILANALSAALLTISLELSDMGADLLERHEILNYHLRSTS
ncbi:MAG: hypothetical protein WBM99_09930, partial [Psychromonas sp.]